MPEFDNHWANVCYNAKVIQDLKRKLKTAEALGNYEKVREIKRKLGWNESRRLYSAKKLGLILPIMMDGDKIIEIAHRKEKQCQLNNF